MADFFIQNRRFLMSQPRLLPLPYHKAPEQRQHILTRAEIRSRWCFHLSPINVHTPLKIIIIYTTDTFYYLQARLHWKCSWHRKRASVFDGGRLFSAMKAKSSILIAHPQIKATTASSKNPAFLSWITPQKVAVRSKPCTRSLSKMMRRTTTAVRLRIVMLHEIHNADLRFYKGMNAGHTGKLFRHRSPVRKSWIHWSPSS